MNKEEDLIGNITSLTRFSNHEEALHILKKLASHVRPIMKKRNWRVGALEEFLPAEQGLLGVNVNRGAKIRIRLRPYYDESRFYDFNDLIGTMLHELTHIVFGPHDASFYKLLDELNDEYDELLIKGFSGDGFYSNGYRVGEGISHNVSPALARQRALEAAEKRRKIEGIMMQGGRRLGGRGEEKCGTSLRELTAVAAERRRRDNFWCGSNNNGTAGSTTTRPVFNGRVPPNRIPGSSNINATNTSKQSPIRIPPEKLPGTKNSQWTCPYCTFINRPMALQCDVCLAEKPHEIDASSSLFQPSQPVIIDDDDDPFCWSCPGCSLKNAHDIVMCLGCDYLKI